MANVTNVENYLLGHEGEECNIDVDIMQNGISFKDEKTAINAVDKWCEKISCPLTKRRSRKGAMVKERWVPGRIDWVCCHVIKYKTKKATVRPCQSILYTGRGV